MLAAERCDGCDDFISECRCRGFGSYAPEPERAFRCDSCPRLRAEVARLTEEVARMKRMQPSDGAIALRFAERFVARLEAPHVYTASAIASAILDAARKFEYDDTEWPTGEEGGGDV